MLLVSRGLTTRGSGVYLTRYARDMFTITRFLTEKCRSFIATHSVPAQIKCTLRTHCSIQTVHQLFSQYTVNAFAATAYHKSSGDTSTSSANTSNEDAEESLQPTSSGWRNGRSNQTCLTSSWSSWPQVLRTSQDAVIVCSNSGYRWVARCGAERQCTAILVLVLVLVQYHSDKRA